MQHYRRSLITVTVFLGMLVALSYRESIIKIGDNSVQFDVHDPVLSLWMWIVIFGVLGFILRLHPKQLRDWIAHLLGYVWAIAWSIFWSICLSIHYAELNNGIGRVVRTAWLAVGVIIFMVVVSLFCTGNCLAVLSRKPHDR